MLSDNISDLRGQIDRITNTNEENNFTIARVQVHGRKDLVTVIGIGFVTTDKIAQSIGFAKDSELRADTNIICVQPADRKRVRTNQ